MSADDFSDLEKVQAWLSAKDDTELEAFACQMGAQLRLTLSKPTLSCLIEELLIRWKNQLTDRR